MKSGLTFIDSENLVIGAISYGELYQKHLALAMRDASENDWKLHILGYVLPLYKKYTCNKALTIRGDALTKTAKALRAYYAQHIAEM